MTQIKSILLLISLFILNSPIYAIWLSVDPLSDKYPYISPYAYCGNNPIRNIDPDGRKVVFAKDVSISFKNDFRIAVEYMNEHKISGMLYQLEKSPQTYYYCYPQSGIRNIYQRESFLRST